MFNIEFHIDKQNGPAFPIDQLGRFIIEDVELVRINSAGTINIVTRTGKMYQTTLGADLREVVICDTSLPGC